MGLEESIGTNGLLSGTSEPLNRLQGQLLFFSATNLGCFRFLSLDYTNPQLVVKDSGGRAGLVMGLSIITKEIPITDGGVRMVKVPVGVLTDIINVCLPLLDESSVSAVNSVRQFASFFVSLCVIKEETIGAELGSGTAVHTHMVEITLFRVCEQTILLRTIEVEGWAGKVQVIILLGIAKAG